MPPASPVSATRIVLVTGAPRSGTSTVAGTLHYLGFHVPEPVLKGNESNPRGFFESWWPLRSHRRVMDKANIDQTDSRPEAADLMRGAVDDEVRAELDGWLAEVVGASDRVVVKDPRAVWLPWLWVEVAENHGAEIAFLTMLRHPAEVLGSRQTYYASGRPSMDAWQFSVWSLCGWINQNLTFERETRSSTRTFVRYVDLLDDWRKVMGRVGGELDLSFDYDVASNEHHEVDDFIEPGLRRHSVSWDEWGLPEALVDIAEETCAALSTLSDTGGHDAAAEASLDDISKRYADLHRLSQAVANDAITARGRSARLAGVAEERQRRQEKRAERGDDRRDAPNAKVAPQAGPTPRREPAYRTVGRQVLRIPGMRGLREKLRR